MESMLLMDRERIRAVGCMLAGRMENDLWVYGTFPFNFLVVNGRLILGPFFDHSQLYAAFVTWNEPLDDRIKARVDNISLQQFGARNRSVSAAGHANEHGVVIGWKSGGFKVETPESQRPEISATILQLFEAGMLVVR